MTPNDSNPNNLDQLGDLEIYVDSKNLEALLNWLASAFDDFTVLRQNKRSAHFQAQYKANTCSGMVVLNAGNTGFASIWTDNRNTPWENDVAMGRAAYQALHARVRCIESAWEKGDDPDQWLDISDEGEHVIQWVTE